MSGGGEDATRQLKRLREEIAEQNQRVTQRLEQIQRVIDAVSPAQQEAALCTARQATSGILPQFDTWARRVTSVTVYLTENQIKDLVKPGSAFASKPNVTSSDDYFTRTKSILIFRTPETKHIVQLRYEHQGAGNSSNKVTFVSDSNCDSTWWIWRHARDVTDSEKMRDRFNIVKPAEQATLVALLGEFTREYLNAIGQPISDGTYEKLLTMLA